jgi:hypothetical protein
MLKHLHSLPSSTKLLLFQAGNPFRRGRICTDDLPVLSSSNQLLLILNFFMKQAVITKIYDNEVRYDYQYLLLSEHSLLSLN